MNANRFKFRVWDNKTKDYMDTADFMLASFGEEGFKVADEDGGYEIIDVILEQSTGLTDKNGREIYEGDVVLVDYDSRHLSGGSRDVKIAIVEWDTVNPCFVLVGKDNKNYTEYDFVKCDMQKLEIIGNIHEEAT